MWTALKPLLLKGLAFALAALSAWLGKSLYENPNATMLHWAQVPALALAGLGALGWDEYNRRSSKTAAADRPTASVLDALDILHKEFVDSEDDLLRIQSLSVSLMKRSFPVEPPPPPSMVRAGIGNLQSNRLA
jgi:hypothetical protein